MKVLITNDDGIDAIGLQNLHQVISSYNFVTEVWIVAPASDQSCASHSMSFQKNIKVHQRSDKVFSVTGTPVDCVIIAVCDLMKPYKPDIIVSGINMGANIDIDVFYSGTVAAAREGALLGIPAIAISQFYHNKNDINWQHNNKIFSDLLGDLLRAYQNKKVFSDKSLININLPAISLSGIKYIDQGSHHLGNHIEIATNEKHYVIGTKEIQIKSDSLNNGYATVTPLGINLTDNEALSNLRKIL